MDFSSVLGSEIKKKRKQNIDRKKVKKLNSSRGDESKKDKIEGAKRTKVDIGSRKGDKETAKAAGEKTETEEKGCGVLEGDRKAIGAPVEDGNGLGQAQLSPEEQTILDSVSEEKLESQLKGLGVEQQTDAWSKVEKFQFVRNIIEKEEKKQKYKEFLEREKLVGSTISVGDIMGSKEDDLLLRIRVYIKSLVSEWDSKVSNDQDERLLNETKRDLVKLMYKLRTSKLAPDMRISLATIMYYLQADDLMKANESYMKLSIGNVAWPIGVQHVGIHMRGADSKITGEKSSSNIMIDEKTRRWITAVKRLITFVERKRDIPP